MDYPDQKFKEILEALISPLKDAVQVPLSKCEHTENKVDELKDGVTAIQYPSAKAVLEYIKSAIAGLNTTSNLIYEHKNNRSEEVSSSDTLYPSNNAVINYVNNALDDFFEQNSPIFEWMKNKITEIKSNAKDTEYPSAKAVYNFVKDEITKLGNVYQKLNQKSNTIDSQDDNSKYPTVKAVYDFVSQEYNEETDKPLSGIAIGKGLDEAVANANSDFVANALEKVSNSVEGVSKGNAIILKDVSPIKHTVCASVRNNKNFCSIGSAGFTGTNEYTNDVEIPAGKYVFSAVVSSTDTDSDNCVALLSNSQTEYTIKLTIPRSSGNDRVSVAFSISQSIDKFTLYSSDTWNDSQGDTATYSDMKIEKGTQATEYIPYIDLSTVKVKSFGKNLFKGFTNEPEYNNGSVLTFNEDGSITCDMVAGTSVSVAQWIRLPAGSYTISDGTTGGMTPYIAATFYGDKNNTSGTNLGEVNTRYVGKSRTITTNKTCDVKLLLYTSNSAKSKFTLYPQLEIGAMATEYEQYVAETETSVSSDGEAYITSISRNMTIIVPQDDVDVEIRYNKDINCAIESFETRYAKDVQEIKNAIISLGGNI